VSASDGGKTQMKARAEAAALLPQTKVTLVAWYGPKEALLASLIAELEALVAKELGKLFEPYAPEQVHATVIGLETVVHHERRVGANFLLARDVDAEIDPERALEIIQTSEHLPFALRIGGQRPDEPAEFLSRDQHPFLRSACVRGGAVVAMGWPWKDARWTSSLEGIRRELRAAGFLHKWHAREDDVDNDGYFVLGRASVADLSVSEVDRIEQLLRKRLAERVVDVPLRREDLFVVAYEDPRLPLETSRAWRAVELTPEKLAAILAGEADG